MKKFRTKLLLMFGILFFVIEGIIGVTDINSTINTNNEQIIAYEQDLIQQYDANIKGQTESAITLLNYAYSQYQSGELTEQQAQQLGHTLIKQLHYGESGYFWIDRTDGVLIAHPEIPQNEGQNRIDIQDPEGTYLIKNIIEAATTNENDGFTEYMWEKPDVEGLVFKRVYSQLFEPWDYIVSTGNYIDDIQALVLAEKATHDKALTSDIVKEVAMLIVLLIVYSIMTFIFSARVSKNLTAIGTQVEAIAENDLSREVLQLATKDEIGQLNENVNQMVVNLKLIIQSLLSASQKVYEHSESLSSSSSDVRESTNQITATMQHLAHGSENQAYHVVELSETMKEFTMKVRTVNENGDSVRNASCDILHLTENGNQLMQASIEQMKKIDNVVEQSLHKVEDLNTQTNQISNLISVIKEIADQTNLLALNAAIEAARAGEQGKGFAVVAGEVRNLAEQVAKSVSHITDIVTNIQNESTIVMDYLRGGYSEVEQGTAKIQETGETFNQINQSIANMVTSLNSISSNLTEMTTNSQQIQQSIEDVASITQQTTDGIEKTATSIQLTNNNIEDIVKNAVQLAELSEELNKLVLKFKL